MPLSRRRTAAKLASALVGAALLLPLAPTVAAAGSGTDDVTFTAGAPDRLVEKLQWDPRTGYNVTAIPTDDLRLTLPPELASWMPSDMVFNVRGATTFDDWRAWGVVGSLPMDGLTMAFNLNAAVQEVKGYRLYPPTMLLVTAMSTSPEASVTLTIWISLATGSASSQDIQLQYPEGDGASEAAYYYDTDPAFAGYGSSLTVAASDDVWPGPAHIEVVAERGDYQFDGGTVSRDGHELTFTLPERWWTGIGDIEQVVVTFDRFPTLAETVTVPIIQASSDPVAAYVTSVYADLFGRLPDPTGLASWTRALKSGTPYGAVSNGITGSREFRAGLVTDAYARYLDREPDTAGLWSWVDAMDGGLHIQRMEAGFVASDEYYARAGGTDASWLAAAYVDVLGRGSASSEVQAWLPVVRSLGRVEVARQLLYSTEHLSTVVGEYYWWLLGRGIDPTGQRGWVAAIQAGSRSEAIVAGIIASAEYRGRVPVSS